VNVIYLQTKLNPTSQKEKAMNTTENTNETTVSEVNQPQPTTNEEILALLRTLVEQKASSETSVSTKPKAVQNSELPDSETKRLLEELLKRNPNRLPTTEINDDDDDDSDDDDDDFIDDGYFHPGPEWETIGYVAGGAALVGLGALLYHWLKD
jgi:hypothetical protein